jgi:hypothetical protein
MKIAPPPAFDPVRRLDQAYGIKSDRQLSLTEATAILLDPGRLLKGRVVSADGAGMVTVSTELGSFTAATATPLAVGREFWFQVVQAGATPLLAEAGKANAVMNLLRVLLPGMAGDLAGLGVSPDGAGLPADADTTPLSRFLAANALDATPDPLKLLKTVAHFSPPRPGDRPHPEGRGLTPVSAGIDAAPTASQKLTKLLDAHTVVNQQLPPSGRPDYYIYPLFFADGASRGEWLFSFEQAGNETDQGGASSSLSFYLSMTKLGDIHLHLLVRPQGLSGTFTLTTPEAADHLRHQLPQLVDALEPIGGPVVITCRSAQFDSLRSLKEELTAKAGVERFALVDVKA